MSGLELALSKLQGIKKISGGWQASCPCHDDKCDTGACSTEHENAKNQKKKEG